MPLPPSSRTPLIAAIVVLVVLSLLPARFGQWVNRLGGMAQMLTLPVTGPVYRTIRWLSPPASGASPETAVLQAEIARWKTMYLQEQAKLEEFERKNELLKRGALAADLPVRQLLRPVIAASTAHGQSITVRAGDRDGVEINTVAVTAAFQLVGKVADVQARVCQVRLITDKSSGQLKGVVMVSDEARGPRTVLSPVGEGLLQGRVENEGPRPEEGQLVRLEDDGWPRSARMLVVGRISRVEKDSVGWSIITVKPTVELLRLSEAELRVIPEDDDRAGAGGTR